MLPCPASGSCSLRRHEREETSGVSLDNSSAVASNRIGTRGQAPSRVFRSITNSYLVGAGRKVSRFSPLRTRYIRRRATVGRTKGLGYQAATRDEDPQRRDGWTTRLCDTALDESSRRCNRLRNWVKIMPQVARERKAQSRELALECGAKAEVG